MEIWKDIKGYEGRYQASNLGRIKVLPRKRIGGNAMLKERILKGTIESNGYRVYTLRDKDGKPKIYKGHRLIAYTFIPRTSPANLVNHIDRNRTNNSVTNLEWVTARENVMHSLPYHSMLKLDEVDVRRIRSWWNTGKWKQTEIAKEFGIDPSHVSDIVNRKRWAHIK